MNRLFPGTQLVLVAGCIFWGVRSVAGQTNDRHAIAALVDSIIERPVADGRIAGASVGIMLAGDIIVLKGYGYADLEHDVPTPDGALYQIGSVTKQFTSTAIMQLVEEGRIDLDVDFTTYLPGYPANGGAITVRRLLDHTSGIKGYTEMATFGSVAAETLPRDTLVSLFASEPPDFAPGDALIYNNSGYFLLGLIIEAVSGDSYEDLVRARLLEPAGMSSSGYCSNKEIVKGRAHGYDTSSGGLVRGAYVDHTWPYSAGSLCSTVGDLLAWNQALHGDGSGGTLLSTASYAELITPGTLNDGTPVRYAMGFGVVEFGDKRMIAHGGGIPGFLSDARYFPDDDLTIVVLINTTGPVSPGNLTRSIAEFILGVPATRPDHGYDGDLDAFIGSYTGPGRGRELTILVAKDGDAITAQVGESEPLPLIHLQGLTFASGNTHVTFIWHGADVTALQFDQVGGLYVLTKNP